MIEKLILRNFQAHERLVLELGPGVTVLAGRSDVGKSSVLRALRWLALNRPSGDAFVRSGTEGVLVVAVLNGSRVGRRKSPGSNLYQLDGQQYRAFGAGVPDDVASLLNLTELNFASQYDTAHWLSKSPGEVSRELNALVDLEVIDRALANGTSAVRKVAYEVESSSERLKNAREERDTLAFATELDADLKKAEGLHARLAEVKGRKESLARSLGNARGVLRQKKMFARRLRAAESATIRLKGLMNELEAVRTRRAELAALRDGLARAEERRCRARERLAAARAEVKGLVGKRCPLCGSTGRPSLPS